MTDGIGLEMFVDVQTDTVSAVGKEWITYNIQKYL